MNQAESYINYEQPHPHIAIVTLNRPQVRNAYNAAMIAEFETILHQTEQDEDIWVIILTGAGDKAFCAGVDLKEAFIDNGRKLLSKLGGYQPLQYVKRQKIWIAALNGDAYGGGFELALHCDLILATDNVKLGLPEVHHSLLPLGGGIVKLASLLPLNIAKEIILTGEPITAQRAKQLGIINQITDSATLLTVAKNMALKLCNNAPLAVQACNHLINAVDALNDSQWQQLSREALTTIRNSQDYIENQQAFLQKRQPNWRGK